MGPDARDHEQRDIGEGHAERNLQYSLGTACSVNVGVHSLSVRAAKESFKSSGRWLVISG